MYVQHPSCTPRVRIANPTFVSISRNTFSCQHREKVYEPNPNDSTKTIEPIPLCTLCEKVRNLSNKNRNFYMHMLRAIHYTHAMCVSLCFHTSAPVSAQTTAASRAL